MNGRSGRVQNDNNVQEERPTIFMFIIPFFQLVFYLLRDSCILIGAWTQQRLAILLIDPLLWIVFRITGSHRPSDAARRNYRTTIIIIVSFISLIVSLVLIFTFFDLPTPQFKSTSVPPSNNSNAMSNLLRSMPTQKLENWESFMDEFRHMWQTLESDGNNLQLQIKNLQSELYTHQGVYESTQGKVWSELMDKQSQINLLKNSLEKILVNEMNNLELDEYDIESLEALFRGVSSSLNTQQVESLIQSALEKYQQDVLNKADYALKSRHASILYSITSPTYYHSPAWQQSIFRFVGLVLDSNSPELAISPQTYVGECWSMEGNSGTLGIVLSEPIIIDGITIEYPSQNMMKENMQHAPRSVELLGIENYPKRPRKMKSLGTVEYNTSGDSTIQTFKVRSSATYKAVKIKVHSNWGSLDYTDIYRIRIHGLPKLI
ncbi:UNC-like C-terminal-domain-containing protein [Thamnidium elegans]|nr:UNC-like C-terminal-domain-containing protein [Thamnidium elegans]